MTDALTTVFQKLRSRNEPVPKPARLPTMSELTSVVEGLGVVLHPDLERYFLEVSDVTVSTYEPATVADPESYTHLPKLIESARACGVSDSLFPFCEDNADFFCFNKEGEVEFWSHNGLVGEKWVNLAAWIEEVWLEEC